MTVGEFIRELSYWSPDTEVKVVDGNLLTGNTLQVIYGDEMLESDLDNMDDGQGGHPETLYVFTP